MNLKRIITLFASATILHAHAFAGSAFLAGITEGDARYDVKKLFNGQDDDLCWAFSASNAIKYWQDTKASCGIEIPAGTPAGAPSGQYSSDIAQTFVDNWTNGGGDEQNAFTWWMSGEIAQPLDPEEAALKPGSSGGAYWAGTPYAGPIDDIAEEISLDGMESGFLKTVLDDSIANGFALTCGIYADWGAHALSLWGYEFDDGLGAITGLWICDSDNEYLGNFLVDLSWNDAMNRWDLGNSASGSDYSGWHLEDITALEAVIPEPAHIALLLSLFAAAVSAAWRRR